VTPRQRQLHELLRAHLAEVLDAVRRELGDQPIGCSARLRFLWDYRGPLIELLVTKVPDGFCYVEYGMRFFRKGVCPPRPRLLPRGA